MTIFRKKEFGQKDFRSNDLSVKWQFFEKAFGQMNFRSSVISVIWLVFQVIFSVKWPFSKFFWSNDLLINFVFGQMTFFGKKNFRSNGLRLNGDSVECTFVQMAFGQTVFGQVVFRSNGLSVKNFRWNDFSVKWSRATFSTFSVVIEWNILSAKLSGNFFVFILGKVFEMLINFGGITGKICSI
jgi:hypothetical protein